MDVNTIGFISLMLRTFAVKRPRHFAGGKKRHGHRKRGRKDQAVVYATAGTLAFSLLSRVSLNLNRQSSSSREVSLRQ